MQIQENISLKSYNTFGIDVKARFFVSVNTVDQLKEILAMKDYENPLVIGGGSNMLLSQDVDRLVIHLDFKGIELLEDCSSETEAILRVAGGENWHAFVLYCVSNNLGGVENMSLIPGNVGASPIQNIGAYGIELKDVFHSCDAVHRETGAERVFNVADCAFGYRDSVFKNELKDQYIITSVCFTLSRKHHKIQTDYGAISDTLIAKGITDPTI